MSTFLRNEIMRILHGHKGRENAIPREMLRDHLRLFKADLDDRAFRKLYTSLPVCSCDAGLFLPQTVAEVVEFKAYLSDGPGGPKTAYRRVATVLSFYPKLAPPAEQLKMFEEGA